MTVPVAFDIERAFFSATHEQVEKFFAARDRAVRSLVFRAALRTLVAGLTPSVNPDRCYICNGELDLGDIDPGEPATEMCCAHGVWSICMQQAGLPQYPVLLPDLVVETFTTSAFMTFTVTSEGIEASAHELVLVPPGERGGVDPSSPAVPASAAPASAAPASAASSHVLTKGKGKQTRKKPKHHDWLGWPRYPKYPSQRATWRLTSLSRTVRYMTSVGLKWMTAEYRRTGVVDFSSEAEFTALVEFLILKAGAEHPNLWYSEEGVRYEVGTGGMSKQAYDYLRLPDSLCATAAALVARNLAVSAQTPHRREKRAQTLAERRAAVRQTAELILGFERIGKRGLGVLGSVPVSELPVTAVMTTSPVDACAAEPNPPLWMLPTEFAAENGRLSGAARAAKVSRGKEVLLALPPIGMAYADQITFLVEHGVTTKDGKPVGLSTVRRWWDEMARDGLVQPGDSRRPSAGGARQARTSS